VLRAARPLRAAIPELLLPDRDRGFEGVDQEPGRLECRAAMGGGNGDHDRRLAQQNPPLSMPENDSGEVGPSQARLLGERLETGNDFLAIGLVVDVNDPVGVIGVVAHQAVEQHHSTALGATQPLVRDPNIKDMMRERDPVVDVGRRYGHRPIVVGGAVADAGHPTNVWGMSPHMPDDESGDDLGNDLGDEAGNQNGVGPHPHPDDRLWRHPSETARRAGGTDSISDPSSNSGATSDLLGDSAQSVRSGRSVVLPLVLIALVMGSGLTMVVLSVVGAFDPPPARVVIEKVETSTGANLTTSEVVDRIRPTVVRVETTRGGAATSATGVIYRSDGYVLTTADAVAGADSVLVITTDGRSFPAKIVGVDAADDIAVLSIDAPDVQPAVLGHPDELAPGEEVLALSVDTSVTAPTTSAETITDTGRRLDALGGSTLHDMIAADGPNAAFDDGVMCSDTGAVLGIFTTRNADPAATANGGADLERVRFATPIDYAVEVADAIVRTGVARVPWLGVMSDDLDSTTTARLGRTGTILTEVAVDGPADAAGLLVGDIIVSIDESPVSSSTSLVVTLRSHEVGDSVTITYIRDGAQRVTTTTLGNRP